MADQEPKQSGPPRWAIWLVYLILSVLMTWPLAQHLSSRLGGRDEDIYNVYWGFWWVREALATCQNPYVTNYLIYPVGFNLVSFAFSPFLALLWIPFSWVMSPVAAYNMVVWATIMLCCVTMDELVRYLTRSPWAALVAGITFAFAPRLVAERAVHLNMAMVAWLPWVALLLTRLMREAKLRDAVLLAVSIPLAFLTRLQVGTLTLFFAGVYFLGLALVEGRQWHKLAPRRLVLAALLALVLLSPLLVQVWKATQQPGGESLLRWGAGDLQTDLLAYVLPTPRHPLLGAWTKDIYIARLDKSSFYWAYVGFIPLFLAIYAAIRRPREALPWVVPGVLFFLLALGPYLRLNGQLYPVIKLPYSLAPGLFSAIGFDSPDRFNLALMVALSVLVGLACAQIAARTKKPWFLAIPMLLILGEYLVVPMPLLAAPPHSPFYETMAADGESYAILDLPLTREAGEVHRYFQTIHHKPIVGGWDHRVPLSAFAFIDGNPLLGSWREKDDPGVSLDKALAELAEANVRYVVIHKDQLSGLPERMRSLLFTSRPLYEDQSIYVLPVSTKSGWQYQIVHHFNENLALARPSLSLLPSSGTSAPQLSVNICWYIQAQGDAAGQYRVALANPEGALVYERTASLPDQQDLTCQQWPIELKPPFPAGVYQLSITPLSGGQPLGAYSVPVSIQVLQDRSGAQFAAMGSPLHITYTVPMEMLGFDLVGGHGFIWTDLFWRSLADHQQLYRVSVQLRAPESGEAVTKNTGDLPVADLPVLQWREGELLQERQILWINHVAPGQYSLGITLKKPGEPISAFVGATAEPCPECVVEVDVPVLVVPAALQDSLLQTKDQVIAYTAATEMAGEPQQGVSAFGDVAKLAGYSLKRTEATAGEEFDLTLYWIATSNQPIIKDYAVLVHLLDGSGQIIAQHDVQPAAGRRPTTTWQEGDIIIDTHKIACPTPQCKGGVTIEVGLYDPQTLQRLPALGAEGERLPFDRAILVEIPAR